MKKTLSALLFAVPLLLGAQEATSAYTVLKLPVSARAAGLGGDNISATDDRPDAGWANPALLAGVSDKSFGLGCMTYGSGSTFLGAQGVKAFDRHTVAVMAQVMSYGSMTATDEAGVSMGSFSPRDVVLGAGYSYLMSDFVSGGANLKLTNASYEDYSAMAVSVDVGLNYFDPDRDVSVSAVLRNIGAQVKDFYEGQSAHLPFVMQLGFSKGLADAPLRFHVTMTDVTRWRSSYYFHPSASSLSFSRKLINHFILGAELLPSERTYVSLGYNCRRAYELKSAGQSKFAGFTLGAGLQLKRLKFGASYAKYHVGNASFQFNVAYSFQQ